MPQPDAAIRKRATKACDQCRRRKTKCDGSNNCTACRSISLNCSYGYHMRQARGPAYVAYLEAKVENLEEQIRGMSGDSPTTDTTRPSPSNSTNAGSATTQSRPSDTATPPAFNSVFYDPPDGPLPPKQDMDMIQPTDQYCAAFDAAISYPDAHVAGLSTASPTFGSQAILQLPISSLNMEGSCLFQRRSIHPTLGGFLDLDPEVDII